MTQANEEKDPQETAETGEPNEGEGSRTAARAYDKKVTEAAKDEEHVRDAAEEAKEALEGPEGDALRAADEKGKRHEHR